MVGNAVSPPVIAALGAAILAFGGLNAATSASRRSSAVELGWVAAGPANAAPDGGNYTACVALALQAVAPHIDIVELAQRCKEIA